MSNTYANYAAGLDAPASKALDVVPSDTTDLSVFPRGIYVGSGGDVKVTTIGGSTVTFVGVPTGAVLPVRAARVHATGTTASALIGVY